MAKLFLLVSFLSRVLSDVQFVFCSYFFFKLDVLTSMSLRCNLCCLLLFSISPFESIYALSLSIFSSPEARHVPDQSRRITYGNPPVTDLTAGTRREWQIEKGNEQDESARTPNQIKKRPNSNVAPANKFRG